MPSFLVRPDGDDPRPAVIVLQEIFGVNREVRRIAELVASSGRVALAINYYYRTHPALNEPYTQDGMKNGFAAASHVTKADLLQDLQASIDWLNAQPFVSHGKIATMGFCFGGSTAYLSATLPGIKAAASFYGGQIAGNFPSGDPGAIADTGDIKAPVLLFFGGKDDHITLDKVEQIEAALTDHKKVHELVVYPDVGHGFFRESSDKLETHEVSDAWKKVQAFFKKYLD